MLKLIDETEYLNIVSDACFVDILIAKLEIVIQEWIETAKELGRPIFTKGGIEEILNLQSKGSKAKPYQVKQVREVILKYKLGGQDVSL